MSLPHNPVVWFEIYVQDLPRAKAFYESILQVTLSKISDGTPELWAFPSECGSSGCTGALVKMDGKDSGSGGTLIYFGCDDCAVTAARAAEHGGRIHAEKFSIGQYGFISLVYDTEGNMIGLHSMK